MKNSVTFFWLISHHLFIVISYWVERKIQLETQWLVYQVVPTKYITWPISYQTIEAIKK